MIDVAIVDANEPALRSRTAEKLRKNSRFSSLIIERIEENFFFRWFLCVFSSPSREAFANCQFAVVVLAWKL